MFCQHCGTQIDPQSRFCPNCGTKLDGPLAEGRTARRAVRSYRENKPTKKLQTILVLSIPVALIALVVVWFLTGVMGTRRDGFEKFLPDNTAYYVELYDPIGVLADFEQSAFFKRLTASPGWKESDISNSDLRKFKDVLARLAVVRNVVGPVGIASIPSFSETGVLVFVRIERDYIGATRVNLEQFLISQNVKYRKNQHAGRIRYDLEMAPNYSFVLMDSGIVASDSPAILDRYIDWLETNGKSNLGNSDNFRKINSPKSGANARARIYFDSSTFLKSLNKTADPSVFTNLIITNFLIAVAQVLTNIPALVAKAEISFNNGIYLSSSFSFSQESSLTKNILQAVQKPISNSSLKYLPKDVVAFSTANVMAVWEFIKEEMWRQGVRGREGEMGKLLQTLSDEAVFAGYEGAMNNKTPWDGGIVMGVQQKTPAEFIKALEELLPELKTVRQTEHYGEHDITCYPAIFGMGLCVVNIDNFVFASLNRQGVYKVLDVKDGKAASFQQTISADAKLNRLFARSRHGVTYVNLKDVAKNIAPTWGTPQEIVIKEKIANAPSPFYLAGATGVNGDVLNAEAMVVFDVPMFEGLFAGLAEENVKNYMARPVSNGPPPPELPPLYEFSVLSSAPSRCGNIKVLYYKSLKIYLLNDQTKPFLIQRSSRDDGETWIIHRWHWEYFPNAETYYKAYGSGKMVYACFVVDRL